MRKTYTIITNLTFIKDDTKCYCTIEEKEKLSKKELKDSLDYFKDRGYEFMINKNRIVVMKHVMM